MGRIQYPTAQGLKDLLGEAGVIIDDTAVLNAALLAGIQGFETTCSRHFLAGFTIENQPVPEETRYFDPPAPHEASLWLGPWNDIVTVTSVVHQTQPDGTPVVLELNRDYFLEPVNNPSRGFGYNRLRRGRWGSWRWTSTPGSWDGWHWSTGIHSLQITGLWGYGTAIPDDAWLAMGYAGVLWVEGQFRLKTTRGRIAYTAGRVTEQFGVESYSQIIQGWMDHYERTAAYYKDPVI